MFQDSVLSHKYSVCSSAKFGKIINVWIFFLKITLASETSFRRFSYDQKQSPTYVYKVQYIPWHID